MKILITGANGQLGQTFRKHIDAFPGLEAVFTDVDDLDITKKADLEEYCKKQSFDYLINCAAYTAVDKAEEEKELARLINVTAVENLVEMANTFKFGLIHISTDFIFDGNKSRPYVESDVPGPLCVYSATKAEAEKVILSKGQKAMIIRTSWLYSEFGHNFVKTILKYARERGELRVVSDQTGTPTFASDLAEALLILLSDNKIPSSVSLYHYSNLGTATWYDFARAIVDIAGIDCKIIPVSTEEYPLAAKRPFYSVMSKAKFIADFSIEIPYWRNSLETCLKLIDK